MDHPDFLALNVYISMCQFKLDQFEESNQTVDQYLAVHSDSAVALNLKSCDYLRLYTPDIAESQLLQIRKFASSNYEFVDNLINHNLCIFQNGDDGFKILPPLLNSLNESKYNLAVLYLRESNSAEAYNIIKDYPTPDVPDLLLKAGVDLAYGQLSGEQKLIEDATIVFKEISEMTPAKDTIPGRQALITYLFVQAEFQGCLSAINSIEEHVGALDELIYNKAMALASIGRYDEAEKYFLQVQNPYYTKEIYYLQWLVKCYVHNKKPEEAWKIVTTCTNPEEAKLLLQIIAIDCFTTKSFYYAMKAYETLSRIDLDPSNKQGMIASAIGVFRNVLSRKETSDKIPEILEVLHDEPDAAQIVQTIENHIQNSHEFDL